MRVRMIWLNDADFTWLEAAWDEEAIESNLRGWEIEVDRCREMAFKYRYEMRIQEVEVPGVYELFEVGSVSARSVGVEKGNKA